MLPMMSPKLPLPLSLNVRAVKPRSKDSDTNAPANVARTMAPRRLEDRVEARIATSPVTAPVIDRVQVYTPHFSGVEDSRS